MKYLPTILIFCVTSLVGLTVGIKRAPVDLHKDCPAWGSETLKRPLFSLSEAKGLIGKKVRGKKISPNPKHAGRIIKLEMVAQDRFLVTVYWGQELTNDHIPIVRVFDKETIGELEILDDNFVKFTADDL